jgi:hypothetical protein
MVLPIFTSKDVPDMDEIAEKFQEMQNTGSKFDENLVNFTSEKTADAYKERMTGVFQDMFDLGYI